MRSCLPKSAAPAEQVSTDANARTITGLRVEITLTLYSNTGLRRPITADTSSIQISGALRRFLEVIFGVREGLLTNRALSSSCPCARHPFSTMELMRFDRRSRVSLYELRDLIRLILGYVVSCALDHFCL